ncbi:carboxylesterase from carbohydrate esterase [Diplodia corticola]|uniref:Carboxylic ester hydrolase n=1 Tax=Diplodia corticola TaxID=236234 RepID=A0A1J9QJ44_9PEZI|nr:carboxylesterase from carbohydrate esterase [Diplodia corticola]OJD28878.1 carboxylesterase from carbohydrate esterase [Diplodia corticola]
MRFPHWLAPAIAALSGLPAAHTVPSPSSVGSDLVILAHNDLYGNLSPHNAAAIVLSTPQTLEKARSNCAALGEQLWDPLEHVSALPLAHLGFDKFWVDGGSIDRAGAVSAQRHQAKLPALCTQSAPLCTASDTNTSERWHTAVRSANLQVTGYRDKLSFRFEGLRYAARPERFTYSTPYIGAENVSALTPGPECFSSSCSSTGSQSEDCLFLNIWTPCLPMDSVSVSKKELRPVMFWIHGGAFTGGTGSDSTFDGGNMASRGDVVVVTINYRLSTLGFLALDGGELNGNYGLADQITALDWVHAHIPDFGGDPGRITIFGQSAGAASVRALLTSPKAIGKFRAAIPQSNLAGSNYGTTYSQYYTIEQEVAAAADSILNETGCDTASDRTACLRSYDACQLVRLSNVARYLVVDGTYLTTPTLPLDGIGPAAPVPLLMGVMRDDGAAFLSYPLANQSLSSFLAASGFASTPNVNMHFPIPYELTPTNTSLAVFNASARLATDAELRCLDYATVYSGIKNGAFPKAYFYEFDRSYQIPGYSPNYPTCEAPPTLEHLDGDPSLEYFKCHSGELLYVFGNVVREGLPPRDDGDIPFSQVVLDAWTAFARNLDPSPDAAYLLSMGYRDSLRTATGRGGGSAQWKAVDPEAPVYQALSWPVSSDAAFRDAAQCDALGLSLGYYE